MPRQCDVPRAGWCKTLHRPLKPAQSGYEGYCKTCFRDLFPDKYFAKQQKRNHPCRICGGVGEVLRGLCRPCVRLRTCASCTAVNEEEEPQRCVKCKQSPSLWCRGCTSFVDRAKGLCSGCLSKYGSVLCLICKAAVGPHSVALKCASIDCAVDAFHLCDVCKGSSSREGQDLCRTCWHAHGRLCRVCGESKGQDAIRYRGCCRVCFDKWFCGKCSMPVNHASPVMCRMCMASLALWCSWGDTVLHLT